MKKICFLFVMAIASFSAPGQVSVTPGAIITQDFSIGTSATATMPTGWKVDKNTSVRSVGTYAAAGTATEQLGGNSLGTSATNGIYNFGAGVAASATDRAVGGLSSSSSSKSVNVYVHLQNNGTSAIKDFTIGYAVEKYRNGSNAAGFSFQLYYSTDGSTWTSAGVSFLTSFTADTDNTGYASAPGSTQSVTGQTVSVSLAPSASLFLAWNYSVTSGSTTSNAQGLAIDDIVIKANPASAATDHFRSVASGNWASNASWESSADGSTNWIPATLTPSDAANTITIRNGHTISVASAGLSTDQTTIETGGQLTVNTGITFTIADGTGDDILVNGKLETAGTIQNNGQLVINNIFQVNAGGTPGIGSQNPVYNTNSTLVYATGSDAPRHFWLPGATSGAGYPYNVQVSSNTILDVPSTSTTSAFQCGGNLTVDAGSTFDMKATTPLQAATTIAGDVIVNGTIIMSNAPGGDLAIKGNLTTNSGGSIVDNGAKLIFTGSNNQLWNNNNGQTYGKIIIDKTLGTVALNSNITAAELTFNAGKLELYNNNFTTNAVVGGSSGSYAVTQWLGKLTINNISSTAILFPVGPDISLYHPVTIANSGTADNFSVRVSSDDLPCVLAPKGVKATWDISEATAGGSDCAITLDYTGAATGTSYSALVAKIVHCNGTTMDYSNGSVTGTVASGSGFTSFSPFGVAVDDAGGSLPVKFANVKAVEQGSGVLVSWSNLTEKDVIDYTVEYSSNGNNFIAIGSINARSNNDGREDYSFLNNNVSSTVSYYRIRSTEYNNVSKYSTVVKIDKRKGQTIVSTYPNPSSGNDMVMQATDLAKGTYTMTVYAANGQQVATQILNHTGGSVTEPVLLPAVLKAGVYTLLLQSAEIKITSRFVVR